MCLSADDLNTLRAIEDNEQLQKMEREARKENVRITQLKEDIARRRAQHNEEAAKNGGGRFFMNVKAARQSLRQMVGPTPVKKPTVGADGEAKMSWVTDHSKILIGMPS